MIKSCKISKHVECNFKKSAEFTSCAVLEKLSDSICALDHLEIVYTGAFILQTALQPVTQVCGTAQRCLSKTWKERGLSLGEHQTRPKY